MKRIALSLLLCLSLLSGLPAVAEEDPTVLISTNHGDILLELLPDDAPITVENFLQYVNSGFYDGLLFHRVIDDFMIQGGGFYVEDDMIFWRQPGDPIINESYNGLSNLRGTIAMARTAGPNSATSQFFINQNPNHNRYLDRDRYFDGVGYCVFGNVMEGMDVVDIIAGAPDVNLGGAFTNFPYPIIYINEARITGPPGYWLSTDLNNDGIVNFKDFNMFAADWTLTAEQQPGDLDGDLTVDEDDLIMFADSWMETADWYWITFADLSNDGKIDFRDVMYLAESWLEDDDEPADLNQDNIVNFFDLVFLANVWLQGVR